MIVILRNRRVVDSLLDIHYKEVVEYEYLTLRCALYLCTIFRSIRYGNVPDIRRSAADFYLVNVTVVYAILIGSIWTVFVDTGKLSTPLLK